MYDTIVIGNDLSSLIAAAILSKHGKRTVLLSENNHHTIFSDSHYTFNSDPFPLTGFGSTQICSRLFADLGIPLTELSDLHLLNPGLQIILPDHRIDCFNDRDKLLMDMKREFTGQADDIRKLFESMLKISDLFYQWINDKPHIYPKTYKEFILFLKDILPLIRERLSISNAFRSIKKNPSLCRIFEAEIALLSNYQKDIFTFSVLSSYILSLPVRGLYYHSGGNELLMRSIRSRFEYYGGCIINNCSVIRTGIGKEIDVDIQEIDALSTIRGRYLIASTKWEKFRWLLLNNRKLRRMERRLKSVKAAYHPFTFHIGVLEKCIPEKMTHYVVLIGDNNRTVMDNNLVFMEISVSGDTQRAPIGKRALSATVFLKESPLTLNDEELKDLSAVVFQSIETYLPFLKGNIDFLDIDKSIELTRRCQSVINQKYSMKSDSFFGISRISNKTPMRNVYMTGGMLLSGLGFEGEILSGVNAANSVLAQEGK